MSARRLRQPEAIAEAAKEGRAFETALSAGNVPPPGYLWVNKFLAADPNEWLPGLPRAARSLAETFDTAAWLTKVNNEVVGIEGSDANGAKAMLLWTSFTTGLAGIVLSASFEFLDEQTEIAQRVDALVATDPALAATKPWIPDAGIRTSVFAEAVRQGLRAKESVFERGKYLAVDAETEIAWDPDLPSKTLGAFWVLLEQECNNYLQIPQYGLFDPRTR